MPEFGEVSKQRLMWLPPTFQKVLENAVKRVDFSVICTLRTYEEQQELYNNHKSNAKPGESKHNLKPGFLHVEAVDVCPYPTQFENKELFIKLAYIILDEARKLNYPLLWGGFFKVAGKPDLPHFEKSKNFIL